MYKALKIKKDDRQRARTIASNLNTAINRKIALVDMLGLDVTYKFFANAGLKLNNVNCLHKIPFALEEFRISDLHYNGNSIFVVTIFNENFIRIPRVHFNLNLVPNYYVITEVNKELDTGVVGGYITPKDVLKCPSDTNYYYPRITDLKDPENLVNLLENRRATSLPFGRHKDAISLFCKVLDETISHQEKRRLLAHLLSCPVCLNKLLASSSFDDISKKMVLIKSDEGAKKNIDPHQTPINKKPFNADFNKKIDILNSAIPSTERGIKNLKFLLEDVSKVSDEGNKTLPSITISLEKIYDGLQRFIYFAKTISKVLFLEIKKLPKKFVASALLLLCVFFGAKSIIADIKENKMAETEQSAQETYYEPEYSNTYSNLSPLAYAQNPDLYSGSTEVKDVSWDVDKSLAKKEEFVNFLQVLGRNIKLNLQNEFILIEDIPLNHEMKVKISFSNNASVKNISMVNSSGNEKIDKKVLDSLYETLSYVKAPRNGFMMPDLNLFLNINLN